MGLRSLFFALQGLMNRLSLLHYALAAILVFIGIKMTLMQWLHIPTWITLALLVLLLAGATIGSICRSSSTNPKK
jgi:tellurite resistance protein TerC